MPHKIKRSVHVVHYIKRNTVVTTMTQDVFFGLKKMLGKLGCIVTSKILGILTSDRNWNIVKAIKSGQSSTTSNLKCNQQ